VPAIWSRGNQSLAWCLLLASGIALGIGPWGGSPADESYRVYAAAIVSLPGVFGTDESPIYLFRETDPAVLPKNRACFPQLRACLDELKASPETLQDFEHRNARVCQLEDRFPTPRVHLVEAGPAVWVSAVGFNSGHTQAVLTIDYQWVSQDYLLEKDGQGEWKLVRRSSGRGIAVAGPEEKGNWRGCP